METNDNTRDRTKGGRGLYPIEQTKKMKEEIRTYVLLNAGHNIPYTALSQKWGVAQSTIQGHVQKIIKEEVLPNAEQSKVQLKMGFIRVMEQAHTFMNSASEDKRMKGAELLLKAQKEYTDFLERWGDKFKAPENVINVQNNTSINLQDEIIKDLYMNKVPERLSGWVKKNVPKENGVIMAEIIPNSPTGATGKNEESD